MKADFWKHTQLWTSHHSVICRQKLRDNTFLRLPYYAWVYTG